MLYFKMSYQLQIIPVRGPECGAPFGGCAQHLPVIQRKEKIIMEEKNQPRRPRRSPEAVSYTHLDVYKRQVFPAACCCFGVHAKKNGKNLSKSVDKEAGVWYYTCLLYTS